MPTGYYYWSHHEYQLLQVGIRILKGRTHQGILDKTGRSEETKFVKYAVMQYCEQLQEEYRDASMPKVS